jgi:NhaA family Na+:H+ antiporter
MYRVWNFLANYSLLLVGGALIALVWANTEPHGLHHVIEWPLLANDWIGLPYADWAAAWGEGAAERVPPGPARVLSAHFLVNDILMALFFAIAGKEVWEAIILNDGSLKGRKSLTPLIATAGGMAGPVAVYLGLATLLGSETFDAVSRGWAIPTATDIAFSYLVGRVIFGAGHPAVRFLLLLAIADDAGGLIILAVFYPTGTVAPAWLLVSAAAALVVFALFNWLPRYLDRGDPARPNSTWVRNRLSFWPYALAGAVSWYAFQQSGLHPALGLLPIVPAIPHADRGFGIFAEEEAGLTDLLNTIEHGLKIPVQIILFFFGLLNAGVTFSSIGAATWLVLAGLLIGKPLGITLFGWIAARPLGLGLPDGMAMSDLPVLGCVAAIGFTVALFVASVAFPPGAIQDAAKMGALFSFGAAVLSLVVARLIGVRRVAK